MLKTDLETPLPSFVDAGEVIRSAADALRPPKKISVSEWAEKGRKLSNPGGGYSGYWRNSMAPFWVEPMDRSASRSIDKLVTVAGSQVGKTELGLNIIGHAIDCYPRDILVVQYSREMAKEFADDRIVKKMIDISPRLKSKMGTGKSEDTVFQKRFSSGMRVVVAWPVPGQLASRPVPLVWLDERDRMSDDIGEGDPVSIAEKRTETFGKNALVLITSTPSRDNNSGIMPLFFEGDQNIWAWPCPHCGEYWTPGFDEERKATVKHLYIKEGATSEEAKADACLVCPHCGSLIEERFKTEMNSRGVWLPLGMNISADGSLSGNRKPSSTASYWLCGLVSPFKEWGKLASDLVVATRELEISQDDAKLRVVWNTGFGFPFRSPNANSDPLDAMELASRSDDYLLGTVPDGVKFLTAAVDVQIDRFAVMMQGWGNDNESWVIDRFDITGIDPANYPAHWDLLINRVIKRRYPLVTQKGKALPIAAVACDSQGAPGVSDQAKGFYRRARLMGISDWQFTLTKGASRKSAPILGRPAYEIDDNGRKVKGGAKIWTIGVYNLKSILDMRLRINIPAPGYIHFPRNPPENFFDELTAEHLENDEWKKTGKNETWDLAVYNLLQMMKLKPDRVDWSNPPFWARPCEYIVTKEAPITVPDVPVNSKKARRVRSKGVRI